MNEKTYIEEVIRDLRRELGNRKFTPRELPAYYEHATSLCRWLEEKGVLERVGNKERKFLFFTIREPVYRIRNSAT